MKRFLLIIFLIVLFFGSWHILSIYFDAFRFDFIKGRDKRPSSSSSILESKKRKVFVTELKVEEIKLQDTSTISFVPKEIWIEKTWRRGIWFWTTYKGYYDEYELRIEIDEFKGLNYEVYHFLTKPTENTPIFDLRCTKYGCYGELDRLPEDSTLEYFLVDSYTFQEFDSTLIRGSLKLKIAK